MKKVLYALLLPALICSRSAAQTKDTSETAVQQQHANAADKEQYYTSRDTLLIVTATGDTVPYAKKDFNDIVDHCAVLYSDDVDEPDLAYNCSGIADPRFSGEAGQDDFYVLYAYFLKIKNGAQQQAARRKKLADLYANINALFATLKHRGTYFGHQHLRISGYVEYALYLSLKSAGLDAKTDDITKQKALYIKSLRQQIEDEGRSDANSTAPEKAARSKRLNHIADAIDKGITDNFYLKSVQAFHYRYYNDY